MPRPYPHVAQRKFLDERSARPSTPISARSSRFIAVFSVTDGFFGLGQFHRASGSVLSPVFIGDFELRPDQIGVVVGVMVMAYAIGQIRSGVLIDRYGRQKH